MIQDQNDVLVSGSELALRWMYLTGTHTEFYFVLFIYLFFSLRTGEYDLGDFICVRDDVILSRQLQAFEALAVQRIPGKTQIYA